MITYPESDNLEYKVKWDLESITTKRASGGHGWRSSWAISNPERWCCESAALNMPTNLENPTMATGLKSASFHSNPKEKQCQRMVRLWTFALISYASKVMFKILQARLQQYVNRELPDVQAGFVKADEPEIKLPNTLDHWKNVNIPEKHQLLLHWLCQSLWLCGWQQTAENP